jgi:hypothetical protein
MDIDQLALERVAAGGAIVFELIEVLVDKDLLSLDDVRAVLDRARASVGKNLKSEGGPEATQIIAATLSGRFSAHSWAQGRAAAAHNCPRRLRRPQSARWHA